MILECGVNRTKKSLSELWFLLRYKEKKFGIDNLTLTERDIFQAILGDKLEVPTLDENTKITIPPGTQNGEKFIIKGKGFTDVGGSLRGSQINFIQIKIPKNLSEDEKNKLKEIKEIMLSKKDKPQSIFRKFMSGT